MKRLHVLILTILVCLIFVGAWLWKSAREEQGADAHRLPPECRAKEVREVKIRVAHAESGETDTSARIVRMDSPDPDLPEAVTSSAAVWEVVEPQLGEADALFMQRITGGLCYLPTARRIKNPDFRALGLDRPQAEVTFHLPGTKTPDWNFQFGAPLPERRVAMRIARGNEPALTYSVPENFFRLLTSPTERLRNRRVLRMPLDRIDAVKVRAEGKERFVIERAGADWRLLRDGAEVRVSSDSLVKFVNRLGTLRALDVVEKEVAPDDCRQIADAVEVEFEAMNKKTETLYFGRPADPSGEKRERMLACGTERKSLFGVHRDLWRYLNVDVAVFKQSKQEL